RRQRNDLSPIDQMRLPGPGSVQFWRNPVKRLLLISLLLSAGPALAVDKKEAAYMGGTLVELKDKVEGKVRTIGDSFTWEANDAKKARPVSIPYASFTELEYGQKAGHHLKTAIFLSPLALFKKARHHYVTVSFKDAEDKQQAVLFEFGKEIIRTDLKMMSVRSGKQITFTDTESQKNFAK
ncbi:MAG TPA: hypothetical protein VI669_10660, partial [Vicinamibacteria bacterium]